jgi:hypothetical protein
MCRAATLNRIGFDRSVVVQVFHMEAPMLDTQPSYDDDIHTRRSRVVRLACKDKRSASAKIIMGAINECYDVLARKLIEETTEKAQELGLTAATQEQECATYLQLLACEAWQKAL